MICILSSVKIVQKRQAGCVKKLQRFRNLSRPEYAIENRDAPNCVHGIGFCAKKNYFNFRNFVGNILANMQQFCLLEEGGGILQSYWKKNNSWKAKENRNGKA